MKTRTVIASAVRSAGIVMLLAMPQAWAGSQKDEEACAEVKARIRAIQDRMRTGYTASQGVKLDARLRRLHEKRRRVCR